MTDRGRLIELIEKAVDESEFMYPADVDPVCIADYLLANGVILPPIKMKQKVWAIAPTGKLNEYIINGIHQFEDKHFMFGAYRIRENGRKVNPAWQDSEIGKTVFLTKEEAEAKLKECEKV